MNFVLLIQSRPLQRIGTGMVLVIVSFILSGIVQTKMDVSGLIINVSFN